MNEPANNKRSMNNEVVVTGMDVHAKNIPSRSPKAGRFTEGDERGMDSQRTS